MDRVITRVTGPQTSYRAELQSFAITSALASTNQELTYDNKVVVDHTVHPPHRECSDMDLRLTIQKQTQNKHLQSRKRTNDEFDRLAKMATSLPLPEYRPTHPGDIAVNGGRVPTPAKNGS